MAMPHHPFDPEHLALTRRQFLNRCGMGFGALGLATLLGPKAMAGSTTQPSIGYVSPLAPKQPQFPVKAKRVIHLFMNGGPSHVDTFDPKPALEKYAGKPIPPDGDGGRNAFPSPFKFAKHGKSGLPISEIFPTLAKYADDLCVIR